MDLCPADTADNPILIMGWLGALRFALGHKEIMNDFTAETGVRWIRGTTPIDRMIDQSTGAEGFFRAFVPWFNENVWDDVDAEDEAI